MTRPIRVTGKVLDLNVEQRGAGGLVTVALVDEGGRSP